MKRRAISVILALCMLICIFPAQSLVSAEGTLPGNGQTRTLTFDGGKTLALQNDYISVYFYNTQYSTYIATVPTAIAKETGEVFTQDLQAPSCKFVIDSWKYGKTTYPFFTLQKAEFTDETPNGKNPAIKAEYSMEIGLYGLKGIADGTIIPAKATVYHELAKLNDASWGVLTTVGNIQINSDKFPEMFPYDFYFEWSYVMTNFTGMGHDDAANYPGGPAIKMNRTTITESGEKSTENSVITGRVDDMSTKHVPKGYTSWGDIDGIYVTEVYTDGYPWANPFVGLSDYYETDDLIYCGDTPLRTWLPQSVTVCPNDFPIQTQIESTSHIGFTFEENEDMADCAHYLWGYHDLKKFSEELPTNPDEISSSFSAKRLAVFKKNDSVVVESVADDAALESLKKKYNSSPVAQINGDYESVNGSSFEFTSGAAMLSPSVTATWNKDMGGKLVIHSDGRIEQSGVNLNAPSFKFYQPKSGCGDALKISLTENGFEFDIEPEKNEAIIYVDIPYATAKLENAAADIKGNLVFGGEIGFKTVFNGVEFSLEKLGYGLKEKNSGGTKTYEFKVNGVKAKGSFDTAALMTLELAKVEGEVNTFKGEERYDFSLELNAFELFETEAKLALERSNKGTLLPDELWFYVKASPGIVLVPPVPVGQLNGGGAGFKDLAATVNGNYFAIPPIKLRGALTGTYLHLIEGTGNVVIGPSEISLKATDVNIVGAGEATQIIDSFGYSLKLNGQERNYKGDAYKGIYFGGSKELSLNLPTKQLDIIEVDAALGLGAFGGLNDGKDKLYLAIGANGEVNGLLKTPIFGIPIHQATVNMIVGGQTVVPIRGVSVEEGFKGAFDNIDMYLGAMAESRGRLFAARAWVLIPHIVQTNFKEGAGWGVEVKLARKMKDWDWEDKGVTPIVSAVPQLAAFTNNSVSEADISVTVNSPDETPYILLSFDNSVTEEEIKTALGIDGKTIHWAENGDLDPTAEINAMTGIMANKKDGKEHRVVLLNLSNAGNYHISANGLAFEYEQANETPFERLSLTPDTDRLTGEIKYVEPDESYVIRTYFSEEEGGADYMISEQEIVNTANIELSIPSSGILAPTGEYYVTTYLMTKKQADINGDGKEEEALVAIDNQKFSKKFSYTNINEPSAPSNVLLEAVGNEVMHAEWNKVDAADGYAVHVYQEEDGTWVDTGFGYDLDKDTNTIDMALTVGGNAVSVGENGTSAESVTAQNLSPDKNYKIGVMAYRKVDGGKYYSKEAESEGKYLPKYTPMDMELSVNGNPCTADENGIYNAYVGGGTNVLAVSSSDSNALFKVTRMDTNAELPAGSEADTFEIPDFEGSLMFRIDGISGNDVTSEYLLVNMDKEPPVLTLSSDVFYADKASGEYTVKGMAHAGGKIIYGDDLAVYAAGDGSFAIPGKLSEDETSDSLIIYAQDSAGNVSKPQLAIITKQTSNSVTVSGSYAVNNGGGEYNAGETVTIDAGTRDGYTFEGWTSDIDVVFADAKAEKTTFAMPDADVTVTAHWKSSDSGPSRGGSVASRYTVSFETNGGSKVANQTVTRNSVIKEPASPTKNGFDFAGWYTDKELENKYDFTKKVTKSFTLYAKWTAKDNSTGEWKNPFADVRESDWFYEAVKYASKNGLMNGLSNTTFAPGNNITRAMFVTVLYRIEKEPSSAENTFEDIESGSYYEKAVGWANANGIINGVSDTAFAPNANITREQIAAIMFRYAKYKGTAPTGAWAIRLDYADTEDISDWAAEAVMFCKLKGIMQGKDGNLFAPKANATRAETAAILERYLQN